MTRIFMLLIIPFLGGFWTETTVVAGTGVEARSDTTKKWATNRGEGGNRMRTSEVTPDQLRGAVQTYLENEWKQRVAAVSVTILEPIDPIAISSGSVSLHVVPSQTEEGPGHRHFRVAVTDGKSQNSIQVVADVTVMIDAVVPARFLKADELIDVGDIKTVRMRVHQVNHPFMTNESEVVGMSAARPLPPDVPMRSAFVRLPLAVKKGDRVLIEVQRGGLSIRTYGITKSSGRVGQTITVSNLDSGRELTAKVVGPSLVQVEF